MLDSRTRYMTVLDSEQAEHDAYNHHLKLCKPHVLACLVQEQGVSTTMALLPCTATDVCASTRDRNKLHLMAVSQSKELLMLMLLRCKLLLETQQK